LHLATAAGIYHNVERIPGAYWETRRQVSLEVRYLAFSDLHITAGDSLYAYSSFSRQPPSPRAWRIAGNGMTQGEAMGDKSSSPIRLSAGATAATGLFSLPIVMRGVAGKYRNKRRS